MWRTLSNEAREAIGRLCEQHGRHLYDYCRTGLSASDAELAVAGALLSAHVHGERLTDSKLTRPWLYALARCHRAAVAATRPASTGSWTRPEAPDLVPEALRALDAPHRELLDLSVRHELASAEIAAIFDVEAIEVNTMIAEAADRIEEWIAAVRAARTRDGCPRLAVRVTDWAKAPGRRNRTRIARHIRSCQACRSVPREDVRAGVLLLGLPLAEIPETLRDQPAWGDPLPGDPAAWRSDGFPAQASDLMEPPPALISLVPGPTTETRGKAWPAAGAAAAGQEPSGAGPPEPDSPGRARRGPTAPPGTAEALLRGVHQTGERLVPTGTTAGDSSSGDTIPYRKRGDFPPMRVPPRPQDHPGKDRSGQDRPGQDRPGQDRSGQDRLGQDHPGQDRPGQDRPGQDHPGQEPDLPEQERPVPKSAPPHWGARTDANGAKEKREAPGGGQDIDDRWTTGTNGDETPVRWRAGAPGGRISVPMPRRGDDLPQPHGPLRSLDPGWRSGRTPVTQYGDKLVFSPPPAAPRPAEAPAGAGGETWDEFWRERPDEDDPEARISLQWLVRAALIVGVVMLVAGLVWAGVQNRQRQVPAVPASTPAAPSQAPSQGAGDPWTSPAPAGTAADAREPAIAQGPAPPVASISPASVRLGERRTGTFKLACTGDCRVTSFSGSNGIAVSGNTFTVRAPAARPGCAGPPVTESGVITVHWTGTATAGGETTTADGTLTLMVSWTVISDRGALIPDSDGGGYWSNCPRTRD